MRLNLRRFDVVLVDFGITEKGEQGGRRPAIIIQNDCGNFFSTTTIVMPLSTNINKNPNQPTHTLLKKGHEKGLVSDSIVLGECMRKVSENRIIKKLGTVVDPYERKEIKRVYDANFGE